MIYDVGYASSGEPITYQELRAWSDLSGVMLDGWSAKMMIEMSSEYMAQYRISSKKECPPPFIKEIKGDDLQKAGAAVTEKFKALAKRNKAL